MLDGIDISSCYIDGENYPVNNHGHAAHCVVWTGKNGGGNSEYTTDKGTFKFPSNGSVDQIINSRIGEGRRSIVSMIWKQTPNNGAHVSSFGLNGEPKIAEIEPRAIFDQIFRGGFNNDPQEDMRLLARREGSVDILRKELARIRKVLPNEDHDRVDAHLESLIQLEERLKLSSIPQMCNTTAADPSNMEKN